MRGFQSYSPTPNSQVGLRNLENSEVAKLSVDELQNPKFAIGQIESAFKLRETEQRAGRDGRSR